MQFEQAYDFLIPKLKAELPASISYHKVDHTIDVIRDAEFLGEKENIADYDMLLLKTAALFHDSGYLTGWENHEKNSCENARKYLPQFDYSASEIDAICEIIMATKMPQSPKSLLEEIICDADLFYLGTDHYDKNSESLFDELRRLNKAKSIKEWQLLQIRFLEEHQYFTNSAKALLNEKKATHLHKLKRLIEDTIHKHQKSSPKEILGDVLQNIIGIVIAAIALKFFLVPNQFFDGGVTGMSLLLHELYHVNLSFAIIGLNFPLVAFAYLKLDKQFAIRILVSVIFFGVCLHLTPSLPVTEDKLLIAIFGGAFLGLGVGLAMRAGAALDGIEVLALYTLKRTSFTITEIILGINIMIFTIIGFKFGIETSLYSILTYLCATKTIDYVVEGIRAYTGVTIISGKSELVKYEIVHKMNKAVTVYKGERGFLPGSFHISADVDIVFTIINRMELRNLEKLVHDIDPKAFIFASTIREAAGGILERRHKH